MDYRSKPAGRRARPFSPPRSSAFSFSRFACDLGHGFLALIVLAVIVALMAWLSTRQIEGQTGDVLGALEQASEIAVLLVALG